MKTQFQTFGSHDYNRWDAQVGHTICSHFTTLVYTSLRKHTKHGNDDHHPGPYPGQVPCGVRRSSGLGGMGFQLTSSDGLTSSLGALSSLSPSIFTRTTPDLSTMSWMLRPFFPITLAAIKFKYMSWQVVREHPVVLVRSQRSKEKSRQ